MAAHHNIPALLDAESAPIFYLYSCVAQPLFESIMACVVATIECWVKEKAASKSIAHADILTYKSVSTLVQKEKSREKMVSFTER